LLMRVEVNVNIPHDLYNVLDFTIETDGFVKLLEVRDKFHRVYDIRANTIIINVVLGEVVIHRHRAEPQPVINVDVPSEKLELVRKLME